MASVKSFRRSAAPGRGGPKVAKNKRGNRVATNGTRRGAPSARGGRIAV